MISLEFIAHKSGSTYGQGGPKAPALFEILKTCPSIISAPMIPFRFLYLQPIIDTRTDICRSIFMYYRPIMHLMTTTVDSISGNTAGRNCKKQ